MRLAGQAVDEFDAMILTVKFLPGLAQLRAHPGFNELLGRLGLT